MYDINFFKQLDKENVKTVFVKLIACDCHENPIDWIFGQYTGGSINVDGSSSARRTCALSLATDYNFDKQIWVPKTRFKISIGVKNTLKQEYQNTDDIIWFKMGEYIISQFSTSSGAEQGTLINIQGKDKMSLLNGDIGGSFEAQTDLGVEEIVSYDENNDEIIEYKKIPIKTIIRKMLQHYAGEPIQNIIINDVDDYGLELIEYRGETPLFFIYDILIRIGSKSYTLDSK